MPAWAWILSIIAGTLLLLLFLFRVRYRFEWNGGSEWSGAFEFGIPGLMRGLNFPAATPLPQTPETGPSPEKTPEQKAGTVSTFSDRGRRALFLLLTDKTVLRALIGYALRFARRLLALLSLELDFRVSHSNPATLGRWAGYWYAVSPLTGMRSLKMRFDFETPRFSIEVKARGEFTLARALGCAVMIVFSFPWLLLSRKAWKSWNLSRSLHFSGWRAWVYSRI